MALRSVRKWTKYVENSLAGQSKSFVRGRRVLQRKLATREITEADAKRLFAELKIFADPKRVSRRDDILYNRILTDTAIREFGFNRTLTPAALKKLRALTHQALQHPFAGKSQKADRIFRERLDLIAELVGGKILAKRFFAEVVSLRKAYNEGGTK